MITNSTYFTLDLAKTAVLIQFLTLFRLSEFLITANRFDIKLFQLKILKKNFLDFSKNIFLSVCHCHYSIQTKQNRIVIFSKFVPSPFPNPTSCHNFQDRSQFDPRDMRPRHLCFEEQTKKRHTNLETPPSASTLHKQSD